MTYMLLFHNDLHYFINAQFKSTFYSVGIALISKSTSHWRQEIMTTIICFNM